MEDNVWRLFYVLRRDASCPEIEDVALKALSLSRCRNPWESGFSVILPHYVVQLLEAPAETLDKLLTGLQRSGTARLLLSEASLFRWFDGTLRGEVTDASLDGLIDDLVTHEAGTLNRGALCALADLIARRVRESHAPSAPHLAPVTAVPLHSAAVPMRQFGAGAAD